MKKIFQSVVIALVALCYACDNQSATDSAAVAKDTSSFNIEDAKAYIRQEASAFEQEVRKGDSTALAAHYSSDALIMPANSESVEGNAIAGFWGSVLRGYGLKDLKLNISDITGDGNVVAETGSYEMFGAENKSLDKGKYLVVWKKEDGKWKIYRDIFNSNLPLPSNQ